MRDFIGSSSIFRTILDDIETVAPIDCAVLLTGETGTGKEVVARAIHESSPRRHCRFVAINCAAIPAALLESELFGHERGAFTGASTQTQGRFHRADGGTLLLDEIGELPVDLQPKLLRVLQEQQVERLGGGCAVQVNVRIIAATNRDLRKMVQEQKFRADLYYRLNVFPIELPPLRERRADIPMLVDHFVRKFEARYGRPMGSVPGDALQTLLDHDWPGNIRELQNVLERAVIKGFISLDKSTATPGIDSMLGDGTMIEAERAHITAALQKSNWVVGGREGAAAKLGLPRTTLIWKMQKLGISRMNPIQANPNPNQSTVEFASESEAGTFDQRALTGSFGQAL